MLQLIKSSYVIDRFEYYTSFGISIVFIVYVKLFCFIKLRKKFPYIYFLMN